MRVLRALFAEKGTLFRYEHSGSLSFFRFAYCLTFAITLLLVAPEWDRYYAQNQYSATPLFAYISPEAIPFKAFVALRYVLVASLFFSAIGFLTRPALLVSALGFFLYEGTHLGFERPLEGTYSFHLTNLAVFFFIILTFAPEVDRHGIDSIRRGTTAPIAIPEWPRKAMLGMLCFAYFGAGWQRLLANPLWIDGHTLQAYLLDKHIRYDIPLGYWIAQHWLLCVFVSVYTMALELSYIVVMIWPRLKPLYLLGGLGLHLGIYLTMGINFFLYFVFAYFVLVEWKWIALAIAKIQRRTFVWDPPQAPSTDVPRISKFACVAWIGLQAFCVFKGVEAWPFSDFRVFRERRNPDDISALVLAKPGDGGEPDFFTNRRQAMYRRVMTSKPERLVRKSNDPNLDDDEKKKLLDDARVTMQRTLVGFDPELFKRFGTLEVYEKRVARDPTDGHYIVETRFVMDLTGPR